MSLDLSGSGLYPYPPTVWDSLARLLNRIYQVREAQTARREDEAQRQRSRDLQDYSLLTDVAQRHQNAGQEVPQPILTRLNDVQQRLMGAGLASITSPQNVSIGTQRPEEGGLNALLKPQGTQTLQVPVKQFVYPGPKPPAFQTLGEMAQKFGLKLRPGVDPNVRVDSLPRNVDPDRFFVDPQEERQQAHDRIVQLVNTYGEQRVFATPELLNAVMKDWETATGNPFPTHRFPQTVPAPGQRPEEGSLGRYLAPQGTQQIPTGRMVEEPILPVAQTKPQPELIVLDAQGNVVRRMPITPGSQFRQLPAPDGGTTLVTLDAQGKPVGQQRYPKGTQFRTVVPQRTYATPDEELKALTPEFVALQQAEADGKLTVKDRMRLAWVRQRMIALGKMIGARAGTTQPTVKPTPTPSSAKTVTRAQVQAVAAVRGWTYEEAAAHAKEDGYTIVP